MAAPKPAPKSTNTSKRPLLLKIICALTIIVLLVYITFLVVGLVSGSPGSALVFTPSVVFGLLASLLIIFWPGTWGTRLKYVLLSAFLFVFAVTGYFSFHLMFKFVQPTVWAKKVVPDGNPWVIEGQIFSTNDFNNVVVIKLNDDSYRMYLHNHQDMLEAKSTDGKKFDTPVKIFDGQMPTVIKTDDGQWRMYYFVSDEQAVPPPQMQPQGQPHPQQNCADNCKASPQELVSAISSDGDTWTKEDGVRLASTPNANGYDKSTMIHPSMIRLSDGTYKLYYDGEVDPDSSLALVSHYRKIMSASSKDGLTFTKDPGFRIDERPVHTWEAYSPKAMVKDGKVILRFTTPNGIYRADSTDGISFTIGKNPIFSPGRIPMPTDEGAANSYQDAYVLPVDGGQRMYFWIAGQGIWSAFQRD